jgi:acyl-CoA synthetase (AMP-forming)/AMP-acid ligase II
VVVRVRKLAKQLANLGINRGDVVSILAPNCTEFFETYYACTMLGAILNPINYRFSKQEIAFILQDSGAKALVVHSDKGQIIDEIGKVCLDLDTVIFFGDSQHARPSILSFDYDTLLGLGETLTLGSAETEARDVVHLYYTSGTTGRAKGVMLTQSNVYSHALSAVIELDLKKDDVWLHAAPMFHLADAWATFAITAAGGKHVFMSQFNAAQALEIFSREKVTITNLIPTMITAMLNEKKSHSGQASGQPLGLRKILSGGAPIAPEVVRKVVDTFKCDYVQTYGMTETSPYLTVSLPQQDVDKLTQDELLAIKSRTGRPFLGVELRVVKEDGSDVEPNDKEVGEIIVKGASVTPGYWNLPEATAEAIRDGWLYTGDLAVINAERSVNIVDRKKDVILTGGETVYSTEVECVLYEHPNVLECAVVGLPDDLWGEAVNAVVVLRDENGIKESDLIDFVKERIAHFKAPKHLYFIADLPKLGSGKIWKQGIRDWCLARLDNRFSDEIREIQPLSSETIDRVILASVVGSASGDVFAQDLSVSLDDSSSQEMQFQSAGLINDSLDTKAPVEKPHGKAPKKSRKTEK